MGIVTIFAARELERVAKNTDIIIAAILCNSPNTKYMIGWLIDWLSQVTQADGLRKTYHTTTETHLLSSTLRSEGMMKVAKGLTRRVLKLKITTWHVTFIEKKY